MTTIRIIALAAALSAAGAGTALAQARSVASNCQADIAKLCADKPHDGSVRICLESAYDQLAAGCRKALDTTGGGRGKQLGKGQGKGAAAGKAQGKAQ